MKHRTSITGIYADDFVILFCGSILKPSDLIEVDLIIPKFEGGDNTYKNKQLLHRHCHDSKTASDKETYPEFRPREVPEGYQWVDDMLILKQDVPMKKDV